MPIKADMWSLHYTINVGLMFFISMIIFVVVNNMTAPPTEEQLTYLTYDKNDITKGLEGLPWYKNYIYQMILLAATIFATLIWLWQFD